MSIERDAAGLVAIDLNSDLGEGFGSWSMGDDDAMLELVTSANIACGYHAGDPGIMRRTCERAVANGVRIGAHVGHRDLAGFGRRAIAVDPGQVRDETLYQLAALAGFAAAAGDRVRYVKPHGALYHSVAADRALADELIGAVVEYDGALVVLGQADTELARSAAAAGVRYIAEGFADRGYTQAGTLVPRGSKGAVNSPDQALAQAISIVCAGTVRAADDSGAVPVAVPVAVHSLCVHGDTPTAVQMVERIRAALVDRGVELAPFV